MSATTLKACASKKNDNERLLAYVSGKEWQNILAEELHYHRSCYRNYTRQNRSQENLAQSNEDILESMADIINEKVIEGFEVMKLDELMEFYKEESNSTDNIPDRRTLIEFVSQRFESNISCWKPKYGKSFLFNNTVDKRFFVKRLMR